jgi:hypothetical protein
MWPRPFAKSGRLGLRVVVDANVWVSALIVPNSPPGQVLEAVRRGAVEPVASWRLAEELVDVLRRPKLARYAISDEDVDNILVIVARFLPAVDVDVPIRDPDDSPVVEAALAGHAEVIVTGDRDLLDDADLRDWLAERQVTVLTPVELLARVAE